MSAPAVSAFPMIPMLDLSREFAAIHEDVMVAIEAVCAQQQFVLGPAAERFEKAAAAFCGVDSAVGCSSGTDALWLALAAAGVGPGDAVITTPFSFYATASAILRAGAVPVFADIEAHTFNLDAEAVRKTLAGRLLSGPRVAALLPVHLYGQCADMDRLSAIAQQHGLRVIEDAAQAFGARWRDHASGSLGDAAAFSFYPTKNLSAFGDAGLVTTVHETMDRTLRALRNHGMVRRYLHEDMGGAIGWNARMDGIQAAVLEVKLRRLPAGNERRRALAARYDSALQAAGLRGASTKEGVVVPAIDPRGTPVFHQYVLRVPRRDELRAALSSQGIGTEVYYPIPLHLQPSLAFLGCRAGDFPQAEQAAGEVLALPIYPELRDDEVEAVVDAIRRFYA